MTAPIHVFVGYDSREHPAWLVCRHSLLYPKLNGARQNVEVHPISHRDLRRRGLFSRPWLIDEKGQMWDVRDRRPFSTEFSHSRFMAPQLARQMGVTSGLVVFMDCDFMFQRPIRDMIESVDPAFALSVVKHDFERIEEGSKMDGVSQARYFRKLWSSLMVFNLDHTDSNLFNSHFTNTWSGKNLHGLMAFEDQHIGEIDETWNWIPGQSLARQKHDIRAVHWSLGGPWLEAFEEVPYAADWRARYRHIIENLSRDGRLVETYALV